MKKPVIITLLSILCLTIKAQTKEYVTGNPLHYEAVIKLDSTFKKNDLYNKGLEWFAETY